MASNLFPHNVNVLSKVNPSQFGGSSTYKVAYSNLAALVATSDARVKNARVKKYYTQRNISVTHDVYIGIPVDANAGDVVQFGSRLFSVRGIYNVLEQSGLWVLACEEAKMPNLIIEAD